MSESSIFWLSVIICAVGIAAIGGILVFGRYLFSAQVARSSFGDFPLEMLFDFWKTEKMRPNVPKYLTDSFSDFLERRNEFWTTYGQVIIATLIIIVLSVLLLTKTISPEAGLPILSAISGFAIAKGVSVGRASSGFEERQER
jgi:quinol-cytochrome oxidoreductase complex cytochrome b subunit